MNKDTCQLIRYDALVQDALRITRTSIINGRLVKSRKCCPAECAKCHWNYNNMEKPLEVNRYEPPLPRYAIKFI